MSIDTRAAGVFQGTRECGRPCDGSANELDRIGSWQTALCRYRSSDTAQVPDYGF